MCAFMPPEELLWTDTWTACLQVRYNEERTSFLHFVTSVCAIVGGVFTVSGIIDAFIYHGQQVVRKKIDLGKFS